MKRYIFVFVAVIFIFCSCATFLEESSVLDKKTPESSLGIAYSDYTLEPVEKALQEYTMMVSYEQQQINDLIEKELPIAIYNYSTSKPNSAGGVGININFKNVSAKTIKYVRFIVTPYNAVGDVVYSEIGRKSRATLKVTGPIFSNESKNSQWGNIWYNYSIKIVKLNKIEIIYMDDNDTEEMIPEEIIQDLFIY